ncbi:MAG TPA: nuclear transport factor 2 family protein, partial [Solirubrobacterales bacterium]|nr:nuclear transport factor 2 family protein [Solirubrobacterales bacterium]
MSAMTERLHDAFEAFNAGDLDRFDELCDPDVEFSTFLGRMEGRTYRGTEGVHEWFANIREAFG